MRNTDTDAKSMHASDAVKLGCTDCHGGDAGVMLPAGLAREAPQYAQVRDKAQRQSGDIRHDIQTDSDAALDRRLDRWMRD